MRALLLTRGLQDLRQYWNAERRLWIGIDQEVPDGATAVARKDEEAVLGFRKASDLLADELDERVVWGDSRQRRGRGLAPPPFLLRVLGLRTPCKDHRFVARQVSVAGRSRSRFLASLGSLAARQEVVAAGDRPLPRATG